MKYFKIYVYEWIMEDRVFWDLCRWMDNKRYIECFEIYIGRWIIDDGLLWGLCKQMDDKG